MKHIFLIIISALLFISFSCNNDTSEIVAEWEVYDAEVISSNVGQDIIEEAIKIMKTYRYDFQKDGSLIYNDFIISDAKGSWEMSGTTLNFNYKIEPEINFSGNIDPVRKIKMQILSLEPNKMEWEETLSGDTYKYFLQKKK